VSDVIIKQFRFAIPSLDELLVIIFSNIAAENIPYEVYHLLQFCVRATYLSLMM